MVSTLPSPAAERALSSLALDVVAAGIATAFASSGIQFVLLKGPSISRWLYRGPGERPYCDIDLLVSPKAVINADRQLIALGFSAPPADLSLNRPRAAREFVHPNNGIAVDVHGWLEGVRASPDDAWELLSAKAEQLTVAGFQLPVLGAEARVMHIALHAAQHGPTSTQALQDLHVALAKVQPSTWEAAARLARQLDAMPAFLAGLNLVESGVAMAARLGLEEASSVESQLMSRSLPTDTLSAALGWQWLISRNGIKAKLAYVAQKLFPPVSWMRARYSAANRTKTGLLLSYPLRWRSLLVHALRGGFIWLKVRRSPHRSSSTARPVER